MYKNAYEFIFKLGCPVVNLAEIIGHGMELRKRKYTPETIVIR